MAEQKSLFGNEGKIPQTKSCERCAKRCRVVEKVNPNASLFVKGTVVTGRWCACCLITYFFKRHEIGPSTSLGREYFDASLPLPEWRSGDKDVRFDPLCLLLPHIQKQWASILAAAHKEYGAEMTPEDIDWHEVAANWELPLDDDMGGRRKRRRK